jgi:hypothetical protein
MKVFRTFGIALLTLAICTCIAGAQEPFTAGTWTTVTNAPPSAVAHVMLLNNGCALVNSFFFENHTDPWYTLCPDSTGSYINGTWGTAGTLPTGYNPLYFGSELLPTGQVTVIGGEYNNGSGVWTNLGAIYNPTANKWQKLAAPTGWSTVGDAQSIVLPNGKLMQANCCNTDEAILTLSGGKATWAATGTGKFDDNDEEGWTMLPNGNILTVDAYVGSYNSTGTNSEIYDTATGTWSSAGSTIVQLWDSSAACGGSGSASYEVGPAALMPNGTVFATGANRCAAGHTAIYDVATGTWSAGPNFPSDLDIADGPGALLPSGNVLLDSSKGIFGNGVNMFEWDGTTLNPTAEPLDAAANSSYVGDMVVLPTGQVLYTNFSSTVQIYTPAAGPCSGCAPTIKFVKSTLTSGSTNNRITGTQFTGMGQGGVYGDDNQSNTNFPLVRITDSTGVVTYCKSHGWTPGVQTGSTVVSTLFDIPSTVASGAATLEVVANGIASAPKSVTIN